MATKLPFGDLVLAANLPPTTGKYFFVHSGTGSNANSGLKPERALATVDAAVGNCTADKGDVIVVMPGHAEAVTSTSLNLDVSGITVINLGNGKNAPVYTYGAAAAEITVGADDIKWIGGRLIANFDNVATAFQVDAAKDFVVEDVIAEDNSSSLHFLSVVVTTTSDNDADGLVVKGCLWRGLAVAPNAFVSILGDIDGLTVKDNYANMAATNDVGHFITFASKNSINTILERNRLAVGDDNLSTVGVFLTGAGTGHTGWVIDNLSGGLDTTTELMFTAGTGLKFFNNKYTGVADKSGYVEPAIDVDN